MSLPARLSTEVSRGGVLIGSKGELLGFFPRNFLVEPYGFVVCLSKAEAARKGQPRCSADTSDRPLKRSVKRLDLPSPR
jgi:hypothetical protein